MIKFNELGLSEELLKAVDVLGFSEATPVQEKVIPYLLENNKSLVALAQTGTGKTAAFGLPLLEMVQSDTNKIQALILCPTRELCMQICGDMQKFAKFKKKTEILAVYGGAPISNQLRKLKTGVHIVVATPGRMNDIIRRKKINLSSVNRVVLDEADEMLNMGFKEEIDAILSHVPDDALTLLFSATMPDAVARIAKTYMQDYDEITVGRKNSGAENVEHQYCMVHAKDRYPALKRMADFYPDMYALVFCRTRAETGDVADKLMKDGYNADALHGDLSQAQRDRVMEKFRNRNLHMLVATDVAARGVDVSDLTHVINYNLPDDPEIYTHRTGRTGRAGKKGVALSIIHMKEKHRIKRIEKIIRKSFNEIAIPTGKSICESQLFSIVNKLKNVEINHEQIAPYISAVLETLDGMDREELIKRLVSVEFNRFLDYYKNTPDLTPGHFHEKDRNSFDRLSDNSVASFYFNVGTKDGLTPKKLLQIINDNCKGKINVGKIKINDSFSLVEINVKQKKILINGLNGTISVGDRILNIRPDSKSQSFSDPGRKRRRNPGRSRSRQDSQSTRRNNKSQRPDSKPSRKQRKRTKNITD